jgi:hypothetical protein
MNDQEQPIPLDVAAKAMDALMEADREIAALRAEIARLREEHRISFNVFEILLEIGVMRSRMQHHRDRCKALAEGREP